MDEAFVKRMEKAMEKAIWESEVEAGLCTTEEPLTQELKDKLRAASQAAAKAVVAILGAP